MGRRGGRPKTVEIDWDQFDKLCGIQCTKAEIADWFKCSEDSIERELKRAKKIGFAAYYEQKRGLGKISLRRKQWDVAMKGDKTMLIWLGKQYLAQGDNEDDIITQQVFLPSHSVHDFNSVDLIDRIIEQRRRHNAIQIESPSEILIQPTPGDSKAVEKTDAELPSFAGSQSPKPDE